LIKSLHHFKPKQYNRSLPMQSTTSLSAFSAADGMRLLSCFIFSSTNAEDIPAFGADSPLSLRRQLYFELETELAATEEILRPQVTGSAHGD